MTVSLVFLFGLCVGSFLNVLIDRLPKGESVLWTRSHCDYCGKRLRWFELIPVVSYVVQAGRCLRCGKHLSIQYPLVELISGVGLLSVFSLSPSLLLTVSASLFYSSLLVIFVSDLKYHIIPDSMVMTGVIAVVLRFFFMPYTIHRIPYTLLPALGASVFFLLLFLLTRGRGMGLGDVKLGFLLGFFLGYPLIVFALYLAFLTGAAVGVILILSGRKTLKSKIAFGPFMITGTALALLFERQWVSLWKSFFYIQ